MSSAVVAMSSAVVEIEIAQLKWPNLVETFELHPPRIAPQDMEPNQPCGFGLGLKPEQIDGAVELFGRLYLLIKWKNRQTQDI